MKQTHALIVMFIGSFIIQYFLIPPIMVNNIEDITNNIGKVYSVTIMVLSMIILEIMMHDHQYDVISYNLYAILFSLISLFIYLYRKQIAVNDKQYLEGMIEHHSMALLTSEEILKKTNDYNIAKVAKIIIQTQTDEIRDMRELLKK
jgi:hypothetical protein